MTSRQWYFAHLRWAEMVEGKQGLRAWKEAVHIFLSEDVQTAFQQALEIGRHGEDVHTEGRREVDAEGTGGKTRLPGKQPDPVRDQAQFKQGQRTAALRSCLQTGGTYA